MRIVVGIGHRDIDHPHTALGQLPDEPLGLRQIRPGKILPVHCPTVWIRNPVVHPKPRRYRHFAQVFVYPIDHFQQKPRAIFKRSPVFPAAGMRRQQLVDQVAVATLDING